MPKGGCRLSEEMMHKQVPGASCWIRHPARCSRSDAFQGPGDPKGAARDEALPSKLLTIATARSMHDAMQGALSPHGRERGSAVPEVITRTRYDAACCRMLRSGPSHRLPGFRRRGSGLTARRPGRLRRPPQRGRGTGPRRRGNPVSPRRPAHQPASATRKLRTAPARRYCVVKSSAIRAATGKAAG